MAFKCTFQSLSFFCLHYIVFAKVASHSPISPLIPQYRPSFPNSRLIGQFATHSPILLHLPICLSFPNLPLSLPKDPIYQLYLTHFPNHLPHLPKGAEKISLTPPNTYPEGEKASVGLYTALIQSLVFLFCFVLFLSRAHTLSKIGHRFALRKGVLTFQQKISFCQISSL